MKEEAQWKEVSELVEQFKREHPGKIQKARRWMAIHTHKFPLWTRFRLLLGFGPGWKW